MNFLVSHFSNFQNMKFHFKFQISRKRNSNSDFHTCDSFSNENCQLLLKPKIESLTSLWRSLLIESINLKIKTCAMYGIQTGWSV